MLDLKNLPRKNQLVTYKNRGAEFQMRILEARVRYGQIDVHLTPINGTGSFWVRYDSVKVVTPMLPTEVTL